MPERCRVEAFSTQRREGAEPPEESRAPIKPSTLDTKLPPRLVRSVKFQAFGVVLLLIFWGDAQSLLAELDRTCEIARPVEILRSCHSLIAP